MSFLVPIAAFGSFALACLIAGVLVERLLRWHFNRFDELHGPDWVSARTPADGREELATAPGSGRARGDLRRVA